MGNKYIIEIEDGKEGIILCQKGIVAVGLHLENESELKPLGIQSAIPYTEPDLEQVRKEAYEQGQEDLRKSCVPQDEEAYGTGYNEGFQCGLDLAWDAARKIYDISHEDRLEIFPEASTFVVADICDRYSASEAIKKIRQYEQEKEEQDGLRQNIQTIVDQCGYTLDEIAAVLEKMRGEQDG